MQEAMEKSIVLIVSYQVFAMMYMNVVYWNLVFQTWPILCDIATHSILSFLICDSPTIYINEVCV